MRQPMPLSYGHSTIIRPASSPLWNVSCIDSLVWFLIYQPMSLVYCGRTSCHIPYKRKFFSLESSCEQDSGCRKSTFYDGLCLRCRSAIFSNLDWWLAFKCHPKCISLHICFLPLLIVIFIIARITKPSTSYDWPYLIGKNPIMLRSRMSIVWSQLKFIWQLVER